MIPSKKTKPSFVVLLCFLLTIAFSVTALAQVQVNHLIDLNGSDTSQSQVALSPNAHFAAFFSEFTSVITIVDASNNKKMSDITLKSGQTCESAELSHNAELVVIGTQGGTASNYVFGYDKDGIKLWENNLGYGEWNVAVSDDGTYVFAAHFDDFYCFNGSSGAVLYHKTIPVPFPYGIWQVRCTSDGSTVLLRTNSDIIITDYKGNVIHNYDIVSGNSLHSADISPDGKYFAVAYTDGTDYYASLRKVSDDSVYWTNQISSFGSVRVDNRGWVCVQVASDDNIIYSNYGVQIGSWQGYTRHLDTSRDGSICLSSWGSDASLYQIQDIYTCYPDLPRPKTYITDFDGTWYIIEMVNSQQFPDELFEDAPELQPCGLNENSSRTWQQFQDENGNPLNGYCDLSGPSALKTLYCNPPALGDKIVFTLTDRKCNIIYESLPMDITVVCPVGDINGDCAVNFQDLALMAANWLKEM